MVSVEDYVARIEGTCGEEKDIIVTFKFDRREAVMDKICKKAELKNTIAGIVLEMTFRNISFRLYRSGKAIFRGIKSKEELNGVLMTLLS